MSNNLTSLAVAFGVLLALIILNGFGVLSPVLDSGRLGVNILLTPLESVLRWMRDLSLTFFSVRDLVKQNELLSRQIDTLNTELARHENAIEENSILREALGFQAASPFDLVPAEILSYDYLNFDQKAILDRGRRDGVEPGDNVVVASAGQSGAGGGILVGILTEVSERTSLVEMITSSSQAASARTANSKASGIVRGEHGLGLLFDQVSLEEILEIDDRVMTSGLGGKFIPNLIIGRIGEVKTSTSDLFQAATVIPSVQFRNLKFVFIVKDR